MIARVLAVSAAGAAIAVGLWAVGLRVPYAVAFGILAAAAGLLWFARTPREPGAWPAFPEEARGGTRDDVSRLAWSLRSQRSGVSDAAVTRVRRLARVILARKGIDIDSHGDAARIWELVGERSARILTKASGTAVTRRHLEAVLDSLDDIDRQEKP